MLNKNSMCSEIWRKYENQIDEINLMSDCVKLHINMFRVISFFQKLGNYVHNYIFCIVVP